MLGQGNLLRHDIADHWSRSGSSSSSTSDNCEILWTQSSINAYYTDVCGKLRTTKIQRKLKHKEIKIHQRQITTTIHTNNSNNTAAYREQTTTNNNLHLTISDGFRMSVFEQMNETLPYWPSIKSCRRKCSPSRSRAVLSLTARWILDTIQTALQLFKYLTYITNIHLLNADSNRTFLACVLMIDSVMPFRSGSAHGGH